MICLPWARNQTVLFRPLDPRILVACKKRCHLFCESVILAVSGQSSDVRVCWCVRSHVKRNITNATDVKTDDGFAAGHFGGTPLGDRDMIVNRQSLEIAFAPFEGIRQWPAALKVVGTSDGPVDDRAAFKTVQHKLPLCAMYPLPEVDVPIVVERIASVNRRARLSKRGVSRTGSRLHILGR